MLSILMYLRKGKKRQTTFISQRVKIHTGENGVTSPQFYQSTSIYNLLHTANLLHRFFAAARDECILYRLDKLHSAQLSPMSKSRQKIDWKIVKLAGHTYAMQQFDKF